MTLVDLRRLSRRELAQYRANLARADRSADARVRAAAGHERERIAALSDEALIEIQFRDELSTSEKRLVEVVDLAPGSTSAQLTRALGWKAQSWHLHFGTMCRQRLAPLIEPPPAWRRPRPDGTPGDFYSGILCQYDEHTGGFRLHQAARAALVAAGVLPAAAPVT